MIAEHLAGRRIAVTGATGFLGTAIVERLLRQVPDCDLVLLVRGGRRATPQRRVEREVLRNDAFDRMRAERGDGFDAEVRRRLTVVGGDFLDLDAAGILPAGTGAVRIVGNLPYNLSSPILLRVLALARETGRIRDATVMLQRDSADDACWVGTWRLLAAYRTQHDGSSRYVEAPQTRAAGPRRKAAERTPRRKTRRRR